MSGNHKRRPCRICGTWFKPAKRGGHHQKTCLEEECRVAWRKKQNKAWRKRNPNYQLEARIQRKVEARSEASKVKSGVKPGMGRVPYPREYGKEVMGEKGSAFIEVIQEVLFDRLKAAMRVQISGKARDLPKVLDWSGKEEIGRSPPLSLK